MVPMPDPRARGLRKNRLFCTLSVPSGRVYTVRCQWSVSGWSRLTVIAPPA